MEYILRHGPGNPRNSEGSFVKLSDGTLYFAYTRYCGDSSNDHAAADIAAVHSADNGETWSNPVIVLKNVQLNLMSVSLLRLQNGRIAMAYLRKSEIRGWDNFIDCRPEIVFSDDEARTWSKPVSVTNVPPSYFIVNNDRMIQLKNGRLLLPAAQHPYDDYGVTTDGIIKIFISDDNGLTWHLNRNYIYPPYPMFRGLMEPGIIELDGKLMCFIRTVTGCHYKSFSYDSGETWSSPVPAPEFPAPESPMSMKRDPKSGKLYAVWNDHNPRRHAVSAAKTRWGRTPLVIAESSDDGISWEKHKILEDAPDHDFCYTAMLFDDDLLHLGYFSCKNDNNTPVLDIKLRRMNLE